MGDCMWLMQSGNDSTAAIQVKQKPVSRRTPEFCTFLSEPADDKAFWSGTDSTQVVVVVARPFWIYTPIHGFGPNLASSDCHFYDLVGSGRHHHHFAVVPAKGMDIYRLPKGVSREENKISSIERQQEPAIFFR